MSRVSVIIPAWRAETFVDRAISSARAQSLGEIEIIVVNDCSPDDTVGAVRRAAGDDARVKLISHSVNQGPSAARNTAIDAAQGDWIAILDADDTMAAERLKTLVEYGEREQADIVADDLLIVNESLREIAPRRHLEVSAPQTLSLADFARNNRMFNGARHTGYLKPLFRTAFLTRHALRYDTAVRIGEDYMFAATALALGAKYALYPQALYHYHIRENSMSRRLAPEDVTLLLAADDRFQARFGSGLDAETGAAVKQRRTSLEDAAAFVGAVEDIKARRFGQACASVLRRPASVRHFGMPIGARLARLARGGGQA